MKPIFCLLVMFVLFLPVWGQPPKTEVAVFRPVTSVKISRPQTEQSVSRPQTQVRVSHPDTDITVTRPATQTTVFRPVTETNVVRYQTTINKAGSQSSDDISHTGSSNNGNTTAKTLALPSAQAQTSMSDYKPPQAKEFKTPSQASSLGGGERGLGNKINEAQKDASAAVNQVSKAIDPSSVSTKDILDGKAAVSGNSLLNLFKQKSSSK